MTVAPKRMTSPVSCDVSMTWARLMMSSSSASRPSMKLWRSRAAWYSAFSAISPCSRASASARITAGRSSVRSRLSSSSRRAKPSWVMGIFCILRPLAQLPGKARADLIREIAHERVIAQTRASKRTATIVLQGRHFKGVTGGERLDRLDGGGGAGDRRIVRNVLHQRRSADRHAVADRLRALGCVDDELHLTVDDRVLAVRPALQH